MTVIISASERLGTVDVEGMLEHCGKDRFNKDTFLLATVHNRRRRSCIQKLATSGQPGAERASKPIRTKPIRASDFEVFTEH